MKVTAQWIAEQCGVSRGTVDRVVNGRPNVAPEVRERVQKIISEYGYKTPSQRQAARAGHGAFRIGVILPSWDAFFIRRMRGIDDDDKCAKVTHFVELFREGLHHFAGRLGIIESSLRTCEILLHVDDKNSSFRHRNSSRQASLKKRR